MQENIMKLLYKYAIIAFITLSFWNCDGGSEPSNLGLLALATASPVSQEPAGITFQAVVGSSLAVCGGEITGHGEAHTSSTVTIMHVAGVMPIGLRDLRFYVSEFELVDEDDNIITANVPDDGVWQYSGITLLDFENKTGSCTGTVATNKIVKTVLENKSYKTVRFTLGIPESLNHGNSSIAPSPLNISGMAWSWLSGYRFFVGEFVSMDAAAAGNYAQLHIGSTGCTEPTPGNYSCTNANRARISLSPSGGFNPYTQNIQFDLKKAVAASPVGSPTTWAGWSISSGNKTCHSMGAMDAACADVFPNFGLDYGTGNAGTAEQTVFNVVSK